MKKRYSLFVCCLVSIILLTERLNYSNLRSEKPLVVTTWDALGYYMYLPAVFIYNDVKELKWFPEIDKKYNVSGGWVYQANKCKNGNYVFKYLGGVSIMQFPFFLLGHGIAKIGHYEQDGFSPPYQYSIAFAVVFYCMLAIFLLRKILLLYFSDLITAITLLLLLLASNFIQYVSVDGAMSHGYIFGLYVLILYVTIKWHQQPKVLWALLGGSIIGLATISRPTEAIMIFIPLLWNTYTKESSKIKWDLVKNNKKQFVYFLLFGFIAVLPQLVYWKITTGTFVFDVGSKWEFLTPHFQVLFGWEKGWFIYTPVAVLFIAGLFFIKQFPFRKSVITFCLLNIYIIIAWHDWRYGASYSCRALVQSYPVFAFPLAALIEKINFQKWRSLFYITGLYLIAVNLFQIKQYNTTVLHYDDMNRKYYGSIYLNADPTPLDMSLLDTDERLYDENNYQKNIIANIDSLLHSQIGPDSTAVLFQTNINNKSENETQPEDWIKVETAIQVDKGLSGSYINSELQVGDSIKHTKIRLLNGITQPGQVNNYVFYMRVPSFFKQNSFKIYFSSNEWEEFEAEIKSLKITCLQKGN
jgi:hypothetical protein